MKLKPHLLTATIALLTGPAFAAEPAPKDAPPLVTGKATITIEVNGHKETREIDLHSFNEIKPDAGAGIGGAGEGALFGGGRGARGGVPGAVIGWAKPATVTWLGVAQEEVSEELRAQLPLEPGAGVVVRSVIPESPAAKAGLQKNDVLVKIDDRVLTDPGQLRALITAKKDGDTVRLTYFRRGQQATSEAKLATHEESAGGDLGFNLLGGGLGLSKLLGDETHSRHPAKALVLDKSGKAIGSDQPNLDATVEKIAKALREVGVDEKSVAETLRALSETTAAIRGAVSDASAAKEELQKGSVEIARALEQVRRAVENVRRQTEEAVRKDRENRAAEKQP